jgi:quinol monooxygenase YgiN
MSERFHRLFLLISSLLLITAVASLAQNGSNQWQSKSSGMAPQDQMELTIFARFHAIEGKEQAVASELRDAMTRVRAEPGCLSIEVYRSVQDPQLFWLHSRWVDEATFDKHAARPETNQFVDRVQHLIDHPFDVSRTLLLR